MTPEAERATELLTAAAAAMEEGVDPFHTGFLIEHGVTLDEVYSMSEQIAIAVRIFLKLSSLDKIVMAISVDDPELGAVMRDQIRQRQLIEELENLGKGS